MLRSKVDLRAASIDFKIVCRGEGVRNFALLDKKESGRSIYPSSNITIFYRLTMLRAEGLIKGKFIGPGKGVWIWWKNDAFK